MVITTVNDDTIYRNAKGQLVLKHNNDILFIDPHNGGIVGCDIKALSKSDDWELFVLEEVGSSEEEEIEQYQRSPEDDDTPAEVLADIETLLGKQDQVVTKRGRGRPKKNA